MPRLTKSVPKYCKHRASKQAIVSLGGMVHYLGRHGSEVSRREYDRLIAEWLARGRRSENGPSRQLTVAEILAAYWTYAQEYYPTPNGKLGGELWSIRVALRYVKRLYADQVANDFGPLALKVIQQEMIASHLARSTINQSINRIRRVFKWAASEELIISSVPQSLATVNGLRAGKTKAKEPEPIRPACDEAIQRTCMFLSPVVADMVRLQRLTGMRPGEVCIARPGDIDRTDEIWVYRPSEHKTKHRGQERSVLIGPRGQEILKPYLLRAEDSYCFSPLESEKIRRTEAAAIRKTPLSYGNRAGTNKKSKPKRRAGTKYSRQSYTRAVRRACALAFPAPIDLSDEELSQWHHDHHWTPNQLRHTAATEIRREFGLEAAQVALGHSGANITQVYAERDLAKGVEVARKIG